MSASATGPEAGPRHVITYDFTPALGRAAFCAYLWRCHTGLVISTPLVFVLSLMMLGSRDLRLPGIFLLGFVVAFWFQWLWLYRSAGKQWDTRFSPTIQTTLSDEGCGFEWAGTTSHIPWNRFQKLFRLRLAWLLSFSDYAQPTFIPTAVLTSEARSFIEQKVREAGGRVW